MKKIISRVDQCGLFHPGAILYLFLNRWHAVSEKIHVIDVLQSSVQPLTSRRGDYEVLHTFFPCDRLFKAGNCDSSSLPALIYVNEWYLTAIQQLRKMNNFNIFVMIIVINCMISLTKSAYGGKFILIYKIIDH